MKFDQNFENRVKAFKADGVKTEKVIIDHHTVWSDTSAPFKVKTLTLKNLDEAKELLGNADALYERKVLKSTAVPVKKVTNENVREVAHAYVYGNSNSVKHLKEDIEKIICPISVDVAAAGDIVIKDKLVVEAGSAKVLQAGKITFEDKGQIVCLGTLSISTNLLINAE